MWLYLAALLGLYFLLRWYKERQTVDNLTEKYVFITGCDSGFGNLLARQLDARGLRVLAACLTQKGAEQLDKATSERLRTTLLDVTSTESVAAATEWVKEQTGNKEEVVTPVSFKEGLDKFVEEKGLNGYHCRGPIHREHGLAADCAVRFDSSGTCAKCFNLDGSRADGLWGLVNNAGRGVPAGPNEWLTKEDFAKVIDVNLLGMVDVTLHMLPLVRRAKGRVVNMSSIMGRLACFMAPYAASKYGVEAFSDILRQEMHPFGVRVSIIEPGCFKTALQTSIVESYETTWSQAPSDIKETYGQQYFERCFKLLKLFYFCVGSTNFKTVTDCMEHALTCRSPRIRYCVGWDTKILHLPASFLPAAIFDFLWNCIWPKPAQAA